MNRNQLCLMNVTLMTGGPGVYRMRKITEKQAREIYRNWEGEKVSAVGHEATASLFSDIVGEHVQVNRINFAQMGEDLVIAMKMRGRLQEGTVLTDVSKLREIGFDLYEICFVPESSPNRS